MSEKIEVTFVAIKEGDQPRDGEAGWQIRVDGELVTIINNDETNIADRALNPLWNKLGISLKFDFE